MMLLDLPIDMGLVRNSFAGTHKYLLYNDPFLGIFDKDLRPGVKEQYKEITEKLKVLAKSESKFAYLYDSMGSLTRVLGRKYDLGVRTRQAYQAGDKEALKALINDYYNVMDAMESFISKFRTLWYHDNKPHGFDVQEVRLGGLLMRLRSQRDRLTDYVLGKVDSIPELEEEILPYYGNCHAAEGKSDVPYIHNWAFSASVNRFY